MRQALCFTQMCVLNQSNSIIYLAMKTSFGAQYMYEHFEIERIKVFLLKVMIKAYEATFPLELNGRIGLHVDSSSFTEICTTFIHTYQFTNNNFKISVKYMVFRRSETKNWKCRASVLICFAIVWMIRRTILNISGKNWLSDQCNAHTWYFHKYSWIKFIVKRNSQNAMGIRYGNSS